VNKYNLFPNISEPPTFDLIENSVIIWDFVLGSFIYSELGFFGKALGERKITPGLIQRPFVLSMFEIVYLVTLGIIHVKLNDKKMDKDELINHANKNYMNFSYKYKIYKDLRDKGYVVRPGMKFGSDFIVYEKGPGFDHSEYVVQVEDSSTEIKAINVVRAGRLATSVRKKYLIAISDESEKITYLKLDRVKI
jgi:tRNA-intron endonuclease, archaea type